MRLNNQAQPTRSFVPFPAESPSLPTSTVKLFFRYHLAVKVDDRNNSLSILIGDLSGGKFATCWSIRYPVLLNLIKKKIHHFSLSLFLLFPLHLFSNLHWLIQRLHLCQLDISPGFNDGGARPSKSRPTRAHPATLWKNPELGFCF